MSLKAIAQSAQNDIEQVQGDVSRLTILSDMDSIEEDFLEIQERLEREAKLKNESMALKVDETMVEKKENMEDTINPPKDDEKHPAHKEAKLTIEVEEEETMLPTMAHGG